MNIYSDRRYIEQPLKPAPPPIVTVRKPSVSAASNRNQDNVNTVNLNSINEALDKRSPKKYGGNLDTTGSPSRSRSATKELICKNNKMSNICKLLDAADYIYFFINSAPR